MNFIVVVSIFLNRTLRKKSRIIYTHIDPNFYKEIVMDFSKIRTWMQVTALAITEGVALGLEITVAADPLSKILLFILAVGVLGIIVYIVKRDFDNNEKKTSANNMLSNMASVDELVSRLRDKVSIEKVDEVKEKLRFAIDEINQYGEDLRKRYRDENNNKK